jgi:formylglycine-generating enzyme required for sulfatase activity
MNQKFPAASREQFSTKIDTSGNYTDTTSGINLEMVFIKGGTYTMGSPTNEFERFENEIQRVVTVNDFYIGKYEITLAQFNAFILDTGYKTDAEKKGYCSIDKKNSFVSEKIFGVNWKYDAKGNSRTQSELNHPVIYISFNDAKAYCDWLSIKTSKTYRLPTAAEWEYACRAGTTTPFNTGKNLTTSQANVFSNNGLSGYSTGGYREETMQVGSFAPNAWGLYDMHGNVSEWCSESYYSDTSGLYANFDGSTTGIRGGNANSYSKWCYSAHNIMWGPNKPFDASGFRVVSQQ